MRYLILAGLILIANVSYGDLYVAMGKEDGSVKGVVDIQPDDIGDWAKTYTMKKADESYRGKQGYELKYENKKLRFATQAEIATAEAAKPKIEQLSQEEIKKLKELIK